MSRPTRGLGKSITHTGLSPSMAHLSRCFWLSSPKHWPGPRSLVTTSGVSVDVLSSGYLDISVPRVRSLSGDLIGRVSPFGNLRIEAYSRLPTAYRSVSRPSSPLNAKAFTKCPLRRLIRPCAKANVAAARGATASVAPMRSIANKH